ncbi:MAG TPA: oligosaccharide flippase family protein [Pseudomonas sp.]|uniref:oligosaccharide flippase family protein n=1 Tax=Pseudomonas sp. TaxID=306 RepID=UPI002C8B0AFD|nr:oligosaccharide flippase family protein [Pseudomonas sp.]HRL93832.1 oligosaccharide flippase family protein [Pseudomonas sp.]
MALRKNIIANYASQLYSAGIGILILPLYIKYMGAEAYGLVGFFTMLQAWFALLDLGLTPTIARETARYHGGSMSALHYRQLFRALSAVFVGMAVIGGTALWLLAEPIAYKWLQVETLSINAVVLAVQIMAFSVALRWLGGLYRGVITGSERLVWLSAFSAIIATLRFPAVFISMWQFGFTPKVFFWHQFGVAIAEVLGLWLMSNRLKPVITKGEIIGWSIQPVKPVLKFALTIAFTSSVWVLVTQTDKLILSGILPLAEYGYFTLAVLVASGIMVLSAPVSTVIMPRMARLYAEGKYEEMIQTYRNATQLVSVVAGSASLTIAFLAEPLLYAWTGDKQVASNAAPILTLYVLGNGVLAVSAFPYYLQYALGNLRYHLIGNLLTVVTLIPTIIWAASEYGGVGAGWAWLGINSLYLIFWVGYVHHKLQPGVHLGWLLKDVSGIYAPVTLFLFLANLYINYKTRQEALLALIVFSFFAVFVATVSSSVVRRVLNQKLFGVKL